MRTKIKALLFYSYMFLLAFLLSFLAGEIFLRLVKYSGKDDHPASWSGPTFCRHDPVLGWRLIPGQYVVAPHTWVDESVTMTILPSGARATAPQKINKNRSLIAIGCSVTQGWEISDKETFMYKLQQRYPLIEFINLG
jgi:hypothetical protein